MGHPVLYRTSWCMVVSHLLAVLDFEGPLLLQWSYMCGPSTSVWNHGTTSRLAVWSDRAMMTMGCLLDFYFMATLAVSRTVVLLALNVAAVTAYVLAKRITKTSAGQASMYVRATACHVMAHALVTCSHCVMLYFIDHSSKDKALSTRLLVVVLGLSPLVAFYASCRGASSAGCA